MICDNEQQKQQLLRVIDIAPIQGPLAQMAPVMQELMFLRQQVEAATIAEQQSKK